MDSTSLKTLNVIAPFHFRTRVSLFRPFFIHQVHRNRFIPLCSLSKRGSDSSLPNGVGERVAEISNNRLLQVVLVSPQIPGNTGTIARTCAASTVGLHLIEPLGFQVDDAKLKRAGLDYWPWLVIIQTSRSPTIVPAVILLNLVSAMYSNCYELTCHKKVMIISIINSFVLDMWLLKFMVRGQNFGNISDNRKEKSGCWHLPREEQTFILISPIEKEIGSYLAQKLVGYRLKPCLTVRAKRLVVVRFESQWLKLMSDV